MIFFENLIISWLIGVFNILFLRKCFVLLLIDKLKMSVGDFGISVILLLSFGIWILKILIEEVLVGLNVI